MFFFCLIFLRDKDKKKKGFSGISSTSSLAEGDMGGAGGKKLIHIPLLSLF